jgi:hypothetical protein
MVKMVRGLGLLAVGVALLGLLIAWLLQSGNLVGSWLLGLFLVMHGLIHLIWINPPKPVQRGAAAAVPAAVTAGDWGAFRGLDYSWLLSGPGTPANQVRLLGQVLVVSTVIAYTLAALASIPMVVPASAWPALIVGGTAASLTLMLLFFHRNLIIGLVINAVLVWVVLTSAWTPGAQFG